MSLMAIFCNSLNQEFYVKSLNRISLQEAGSSWHHILKDLARAIIFEETEKADMKIVLATNIAS